MASSGKRIRKTIFVILFIAIFIFCAINPYEIPQLTSLSNQEFFLRHTKDVADYTVLKDTKDVSNFRLATGTYEEEKDGPLFGIAKGRNLIIIQLESMQEFLVRLDYNGQEVTPFINSLIEDDSSIYFDNFYHQIGAGNTSDAEFAANNSIVGSIESYTYQLYQNNYFYGLPWVLRENGYTANVYHGYDKEFWNRINAYPALGFERYYNAEDYESDNVVGLGAGNITGISDRAFYAQTAKKLSTLKEPFYSLIISLSAHNPFGVPEELRRLELLPKDENIVGYYMRSESFADECLEEMFEHLKEEGLYDNSLIVMYGDHFAMSRTDEAVTAVVSDIIGRQYTYADMLRVPCLIHIPGESVHDINHISGGQIDLLPTIAYLLGLEELDTVYLGTNLLTAESNVVPFQFNMLKGSFVDNDVVFEMSKDGVYSHSYAYSLATGEELSAEDYFDEYEEAKEMIELSEFYLRNDVLRLAVEEGLTEEQISARLSGNDKPETELTVVTLNSNDKDEVDAVFDDIIARIEKAKAEGREEYFALRTTYKPLKRTEERHSGKSGKVGTVFSLDGEKAGDYAEFKKYVYPVIPDLGDFVKVGYLGYGHILVEPDFAVVTDEELTEFAGMMKPSGVFLNSDALKAHSRAIKQAEKETGSDIMIYCTEGTDIRTKFRVFRAGAEGRFIQDM